MAVGGVVIGWGLWWAWLCGPGRNPVGSMFHLSGLCPRPHGWDLVLMCSKASPLGSLKGTQVCYILQLHVNPQLPQNTKFNQKTSSHGGPNSSVSQALHPMPLRNPTPWLGRCLRSTHRWTRKGSEMAKAGGNQLEWPRKVWNSLECPGTVWNDLEWSETAWKGLGSCSLIPVLAHVQPVRNPGGSTEYT